MISIFEFYADEEFLGMRYMKKVFKKIGVKFNPAIMSIFNKKG